MSGRRRASRDAAVGALERLSVERVHVLVCGGGRTRCYFRMGNSERRTTQRVHVGTHTHVVSQNHYFHARYLPLNPPLRNAPMRIAPHATAPTAAPPRCAACPVPDPPIPICAPYRSRARNIPANRLLGMGMKKCQSRVWNGNSAAFRNTTAFTAPLAPNAGGVNRHD